MPKYKVLQRIWSTEHNQYFEAGEEAELNLETVHEALLIENHVLEPVGVTVVRTKKKVEEADNG